VVLDGVLDPMRNYQTLTLIGSIFGILIAVGFWIFASSFEPFVTEFATEETAMENRETMSYAAIAVPVVIILEIAVFVAKPTQLKPVGIFLIVVSVIVLIGTSWYGILPFALFLPAGIIALRYKPKPGEEPEVRYRSDGSPIR
jgi:hypothetical protein